MCQFRTPIHQTSVLYRDLFFQQILQTLKWQYPSSWIYLCWQPLSQKYVDIIFFFLRKTTSYPISKLTLETQLSKKENKYWCYICSRITYTTIEYSDLKFPLSYVAQYCLLCYLHIKTQRGILRNIFWRQSDPHVSIHLSLFSLKLIVLTRTPVHHLRGTGNLRHYQCLKAKSWS